MSPIFPMMAAATVASRSLRLQFLHGKPDAGNLRLYELDLAED
jgi:hypothetical protein